MKHSFRKQCIAGITASVAMSFSLMVAADTNRAFVPMGTADAVGGAARGERCGQRQHAAADDRVCEVVDA